MAEQLYALQRDLEMIATQVQSHNIAYTKLDWMCQKMKKLEEELTCQGAQMRRMENLLLKICRKLHVNPDL